MSTPIYTSYDHRKNLTVYWQQYYPNYIIPNRYHVHHIYPKSLCKQDHWLNERINHPKNLIALYPDDHVSIHKCRGDKQFSENFIWNIAGKKWTNESKLKMSKSRKGIPRSEETKRKISKSNTGKHHTAATKEKLRKINLGKKHGPRNKEQIERISEAVKKSMTPELLIKKRMAALGKTHSDETKQKISEFRTGRKYYNNGSICKMYIPGTEPNGFKLGQLKR